MPVISIRRCIDLDLIKRLDLRVFQNPGELSPAAELEESTWWVAWSDGEPVGYAGARRARTEPRTVFLARTGVLPSARGHGLQRRFIRCRERWARGQGFGAAITYTVPSNCPSSNNLITLGYRTCTGAYMGDRVIYWRKRLVAVEVQSDE